MQWLVENYTETRNSVLSRYLLLVVAWVHHALERYQRPQWMCHYLNNDEH